MATKKDTEEADEVEEVDEVAPAKKAAPPKKARAVEHFGNSTFADRAKAAGRDKRVAESDSK